MIEETDSTNPNIQIVPGCKDIMDRKHADAVEQRASNLEEYAAAKKKLADIIRVISKIESMEIKTE